MVLCRASSLQPWVEKCSSLPILLYIVYYATCTLLWILIWSMEIKITFDLTMVEDTQTLFLCFKNSIVIISLLYLWCLRNACLRAMHSETHKMQLECLPWVCVYIPYCLRCKMWTKKLCTVSDMLGLTVTQTTRF